MSLWICGKKILLGWLKFLFLKTKTAVDKSFPLKAIKQIKDKLRNLEGSYEKAKENNQKQEFH